MTRHAKNNTANPVFSYMERRKLKWGTQKSRIGADSQLAYDCCGLCLHPVEEALVCHKGHLFCKACIFEFMLAQKQHIKKQQEQFEEQQKQASEEQQQTELKLQAEKAAKFERMENSILPQYQDLIFSAKTVSDVKYVPAGYEPVVTPKGILYRLKMTDELAKKEKQLVCYWIPNMTPDGAKVKVEKPSEVTTCPIGNHPLRLKQLMPIRFSEHTSDQAKGSKDKHMCPCCRKTITNVVKPVALRQCGHVLCRGCAQLSRKDKLCANCQKETSEDDVVELQAGGTGFASGGGQVIETMPTPAFQG